MRTLARTLQVILRHDESCFHNRQNQASCSAPRMRNTASVSLHCNGSHHLSLFAVNGFLPLQFCGSSSDVIRGFKHWPLRGKRRGRDPARDTNGSIASIGITVTLQDALERLSSYQFSHYTVRLRSDAN